VISIGHQLASPSLKKLEEQEDGYMDEIISSICKNRHVSDFVCLSFVVG